MYDTLRGVHGKALEKAATVLMSTSSFPVIVRPKLGVHWAIDVSKNSKGSVLNIHAVEWRKGSRLQGENEDSHSLSSSNISRHGTGDGH